MSIAVPLDELRETVDRHGWAAFVLVTGTDARPRVSHRVLEWSEGALSTPVGRATALGATAHPAVSVLWPGPGDGYSLIVDGDGRVEWHDDADPVLSIAPTWAVLHRMAGC